MRQKPDTRRRQKPVRGVGGAGRAPRRAAPSETHYRLVFEHDLIAMYRTTLDGRILDCNKSMARMLGFASRAELLRHRATELYCTPAARREFIARLQAAGQLTNSELRLRRKDGTTVYVLENVSLVPNPGGGPATIQGAMVNITERQRAEEALRESAQRYRQLSEELRRLTQHVQDVREEERRRIARDLHDDLGQSLTVVSMDLQWLRDRLAANSPLAPRVAALCELVERAIGGLRRICSDLRPALLDDLGLLAAIDWLLHNFESRSGVRCQARLPRALPPLPADQATAIFRVLQECLTNVARHAQADKVQVALQVRGSALTVRVSDNGVGMLPETPPTKRRMGLMGMRERAIRWGGAVTVTSARGRGTTVRVTMPVGGPGQEQDS